MDVSYNRRLILILLGFLYIGFLLACETSPPYNAIPAPITQESGDANFAELLNSIRLEERLTGLAAAIIIDSKLHSAAAVGVRESGTDNWLTVNDKFLIYPSQIETLYYQDAFLYNKIRTICLLSLFSEFF